MNERNILEIMFVLVVILLGIGSYRYFHTSSSPKIIMAELPAVKINPADKKIMPDVAKKIEIIPEKAPLGKTAVTTVLIDKELKTIQVTKFVNQFSWFGGFGIYGSGALQGFDGGLSILGPSYWRIQSGALLGTKNTSLMIGFKVMGNTIAGISYGINYQTLLPAPAVFISLGF